MVIWATSMLVTDVGDKICWRHFWDVGNGFGWFCRQHPLSFSISVHQHPKDVTNIEILSLTPENCHQHLLCSRNLLPRLWGHFDTPAAKKLLWKSFRTSNLSNVWIWIMDFSNGFCYSIILEMIYAHQRLNFTF